MADEDLSPETKDPDILPQGGRWSNLKPAPPGERGGKDRPPRPPKDISYRDGCCRLGSMSRILGITPSQLDSMAKYHRLTYMVHNGDRWFHVDDTIRLAMNSETRCPPLISPKSTEAEDCRWAWNALALGPWNCVTAPSGHAWMLYLDGKKYVAVRTKLGKMFYAMAGKQLQAIGQQKEEPEPTTVDEVVEQSKIEEERQEELSPAMKALEALDAGMVAGPFAIDGEGY